MSKPVANNKITYPNIYGRVIAHDDYLNQGVRLDDSPTFANLQLTGDAVVNGSLYVYGNTVVMNTNLTEFEDNILLLNRLETGPGVTLNQSGIEIERGTLENYRIVYNESDSTFRSGVVSNLKCLVHRESTPFNNGITFWNDTTKQIETRDTVDIAVKSSVTVGSTNASTGALTLQGGLGVRNDISMDGVFRIGKNEISNVSGETVITSTMGITLSPRIDVTIPYNKRLAFGTTAASIVVDSGSRAMGIYGEGNIEFNLRSGYRINIPNQIPITFATQNEKIYTDGDNNMVIAGFQDILLNPGTNKKILVPETASLAFYNQFQKIYGTISSDLYLAAGNDIYLTPGLLKDIRVPVDNGIRFGSTGLQRIYADSSSDLYMKATGNIYLSTPTVKVTTIDFGNGALVYGTTGNVISIGAQNLYIESTVNSTNASNGSLVVKGGVGVGRDLSVQGNMTVNGNLTVNGTTVTVNTETVLVKDNLIVLNSSPISEGDGGILIKRYNGSVGTTGNNYAGVFYKESRDLMSFAYTASDPGAGELSISNYMGIETGIIRVTDTSNSTDVSNGSINTPGGLSVGKDIVVGGKVTSPLVNANSCNITGTCNASSVSAGNVRVTHTTVESLHVTTTGLFNCDTTFQRDATVSGVVRLQNTTPSTNGSNGALVVAGGVTITTTTNALGPGAGGALSVAGGVWIGGDILVTGSINGVGNASNSYAYLTLTSTDQAVNATTGSLVTFGGITVQSTADAVSSTNGGGLLVMGGVGVKRNIIIGENMDSESVTTRLLTVDGPVEYSGNGLFEYLNTVGYNYLGQLEDTEFTQLTISYKGGSLQTFLSVTGSDLEASSLYKGSTPSARVIVYDNLGVFHVFVKTIDVCTLHVHVKRGSSIIVVSEGNGLSPDGSNSGYNGTWVGVYDSSEDNHPGTHVTQGNTLIRGSLDVTDPLMVVGRGSTNDYRGVLFQRFQDSNDIGTGDVAGDIGRAIFSGTIGNQLGASSLQIKLPSSTNATNSFYDGYFVRVGNQVRRIVDYNGAQRVAEVDVPFTNNPQLGDTVYLFNGRYVGMYYSESAPTPKFTLATVDKSDLGVFNKVADASLGVSELVISSTQASMGLSTGALIAAGGVCIKSTAGSSHFTSGGALTVGGGVGVGGTLAVRDTLILGDTNQTSSTIRMQYTDSATLNFKDLFRLTATNDQFAIQTSTSNSLVVGSTGNVLINSTLQAHEIYGTNRVNVCASEVTSGARLLLDNSGKSGLFAHSGQSLELGSGTNGTTVIVRSDNVSITSTQYSTGASTGALQVEGGITVNSEQNSVSVTNGGSLTVLGGVSIKKDLFIGGNIFLTGNVQSTGASEQPSLTFSNTVNCTITGYNNSQLIYVSNEALLSFVVTVNCTAASANCQFEFNLPSRTNNFASRSDLVANVSGYTGSLDVLFNTLGVAVVSSKRGLVKFQSVDTTLHYISVMCRYTAA